MRRRWLWAGLNYLWATLWTVGAGQAGLVEHYAAGPKEISSFHFISFSFQFEI
jgi:hypothetical protein